MQTKGIGRAVLIISRQVKTTTTDVYIPTTVRLLNFEPRIFADLDQITSDIYSNVTQMETLTTTTTTEEETT
jgi:hypothetical protein